MGLKDMFKNAMKERHEIDIIAGGEALNLTGKPVPSGIRKVSFVRNDKPNYITVEIPFLSKDEWILDEVSWEESGTRSIGKAAAGAIVGGVLTGGVGAIAGAAIGGRRKDKSKAFVYLVHPETNEEVGLHIRCSEDLYAKISRLR